MSAIGFLPALAQDVLPQTSEQWQFAILLVTSIVGGVSGIFGYFKSRETKRVDALQKFTKLIKSLLGYEYARGLRDGDSFLMRMARGDVSIDDLNERNKKHG